jgi:hypothetical protein
MIFWVEHGTGTINYETNQKERDEQNSWIKNVQATSPKTIEPLRLKNCHYYFCVYWITFLPK